MAACFLITMQSDHGDGNENVDGALHTAAEPAARSAVQTLVS